MIRVEKAKVGEVQEIKRVLNDAWSDTYSSFLSPETIKKLTTSWHDPKILASQMKAPDTFFAVARDDSNLIVGLITAQRDNKDVLVIQRLYVDPLYQRKGAGGKLLKECVSAFPKVRRIQLEVEERNQKGRSFFVKQGFKQVGTEKESMEDEFLMIVNMEKHLTLGSRVLSGRKSGHLRSTKEGNNH